jgi:hypothetical protein
MVTLTILPTFRNDEILIILGIKSQTIFNVRIVINNLAIGGKNLMNNLAVMI